MNWGEPGSEEGVKWGEPQSPAWSRRANISSDFQGDQALILLSFPPPSLQNSIMSVIMPNQKLPSGPDRLQAGAIHTTSHQIWDFLWRKI